MSHIYSSNKRSSNDFLSSFLPILLLQQNQCFICDSPGNKVPARRWHENICRLSIHTYLYILNKIYACFTMSDYSYSPNVILISLFCLLAVSSQHKWNWRILLLPETEPSICCTRCRLFPPRAFEKVVLK